MSRHEDLLRLGHMLDHAREAVAMVRGQKRADLDSDRKLNLSLVRLVEIVGEAASRVSPAGRERAPGLDWKRIVGMRNRIVHGYDSVDFDILWDTIQIDLPPLVEELEKLLGRS